MFMCTVLLFFYFPTAPLVDIMKFVLHERYHDDESDKDKDDERIAKWLPSQMRYIHHFAALIRLCYKKAANEGELDENMEAIQHALSEHISQQTSSIRKQTDEALKQEFDACPKRLWSVYHRHAESFLNKVQPRKKIKCVL